MNSASSKSTRTSLFFANYGFYPRLGFEPIETVYSAPAYNAKKFASTIERITEYLRTKLTTA